MLMPMIMIMLSLIVLLIIIIITPFQSQAPPELRASPTHSHRKCPSKSDIVTITNNNITNTIQWKYEIIITNSKTALCCVFLLALEPYHHTKTRTKKQLKAHIGQTQDLVSTVYCSSLLVFCPNIFNFSASSTPYTANTPQQILFRNMSKSHILKIYIQTITQKLRRRCTNAKVFWIMRGNTKFWIMLRNVRFRIVLENLRFWSMLWSRRFWITWFVLAPPKKRKSKGNTQLK